MVSTTEKVRTVNWGPVGEAVYERTYSRRKADGSHETWEETVGRVVDGNLSLVDERHHLKGEREELFDLLYNFRALPAGRHLWVAGVPGRQFLFNCHTAGWRDKLSDHYAFTFDELMKGGGVGSNYSNKYVGKYAPIRHSVEVHVVCDPAHPDYADMEKNGLLSTEYHHEWPGCIPVEDSREGWVDALVRLLDMSHAPLKPWGGKYGDSNQHLVFDVSRVREKGAPIRGFGGTASGPGPLAAMLLAVALLLQSRLGERLSSLDHMQIDHLIASCVVAGNVRRSARMAIKYWKDPDIFDFITCKVDEERRAHNTTNISVEIDHAFFRAYKRGDKHAKRVYRECIKSMTLSGEPGFWNSSLAQVGEVEEIFCTNPCGEICLEPFENCNLGHVNLDAYYDNPEGGARAFQLMTRFLIRATFADITSSLQRAVVDKNRRIGVGFFGYQGWTVKQGIKYSESHQSHKIKTLLRKFYAVIRSEARSYCSELRIPECIKVSTVAPTGTTAKLPGKSEGAQAIFGKYFDRRVVYAKDSPLLKQLEEDGVPLETSYYDPENSVVATFRCKDRLVEEVEELGMDVDLIEDQGDITLSDCLAIQAMIQREFADNSISFTVNMPPLTENAEKNEIENRQKELYHTIMHYLPELKGTTVILGAGDRPQTPYTRITKEEYDEHVGPKFTAQGELECGPNACPVK
jgi:ribonucleoside-triphosphate reductase